MIFIYLFILYVFVLVYYQLVTVSVQFGFWYGSNKTDTISTGEGN